MPLIHLTTNLPLSAEQEKGLKARFGQAIALLPGKSERWLMVKFEPEARLWLAGGGAPCALLQVGVYGAAPANAYNALTAALTEAVCATLLLAPERVYVQYAETPHWGWNGENF